MITRAWMLALGLTACLSGSATAQTVIYETYSPVVTAQYVAPAPVYRYGYRGIAGSTFTNYYPTYTAPVVTAYSPVVTAAPVVTSYSPVVTETPVVSYSPVVAEAPVVTSYSPVVSEVYSPVVTTYSPVVTTAYSPVVTSYYVPTVVRSKVLYVPGQPVRNFFRAITP